MNIVRRSFGALRHVVGFGRLALAVGLLATLWLGTVKGVERSSREADQRRASDRSALATAFASSVGEWLDAGRNEALILARSEPSLPAIDAFLAQRHAFSRDALVFSGSIVTAASPSYGSLLGLRANPCVRTDESGEQVADDALNQLVEAARTASAPVVSRIFDVPGTCAPAVAVAVSTASTVTVVLGDVEDLTARLAAGALITEEDVSSGGSGDEDAIPPGGTRVFLVAGDVALEPRLGIVTTPPRTATFIGAAEADGPQRSRYPVGEGSDAEVLAAYAPVAPGWSVVFEQDAAVFDIELQERPSLIVASVLTVVFAAVFAMLAFFDLRRRRAQRRAEVAKNAFFAIAGHELRTPLTVIKGFAEMLTSNWHDIDDGKRHSLVERIVPQARRLDRLVERLLVAASIQAQTHTRPEVTAVDPVVALEDVASRFRDLAPLHDFVVDVPEHVPPARADQRALDQALDHIVDNAVKYSPSGGRIGLRATVSPRRVQLVVEDEGVGLPADRRRIFDKFVQGESVTKRVHDEGGVGLGLYIVRTLVEDMGGTVGAEPRAEGGARFIVTLRTAETVVRGPSAA